MSHGTKRESGTIRARNGDTGEKQQCGKPRYERSTTESQQRHEQTPPEDKAAVEKARVLRRDVTAAAE